MPLYPINVDITPDTSEKVTLGSALRRFKEIVVGTVTATAVVATTVTATTVTAALASVKRYSSVQLAKASGTLTVADCGTLIVSVVDGAFTLPTAALAGAGATMSIMNGALSAGTGVVITRGGTDTLNAKASIAGAAITNATTLTNAGASDVLYDLMELTSDGVDHWWSTNQSGTWA